MSGTHTAVGGSVTRARWMSALAASSSGFQNRGTKRRHSRFVIKGSVKLIFLPMEGGTVPTTPWFGEVLNASAEGLLLRVLKAIPAGTMLRLQLQLKSGHVALGGECVHCTQCAGGTH